MDGIYDSKNRYMIWLIGMVVGSFIVVISGFLLDTYIWLMALVIVGVLWIFYKFFKGRDSYMTEGLGLLTLIEFGVFLTLEGFILSQIHLGGVF